NFPRYDLDMGVLRAYENGKPAEVRDFFPFSRNGAEAGELTVVIGHPGGTERQLTVAQLETMRDIDLVWQLATYSEQRGVLEQFTTESDEHARIGEEDLWSIENYIKEVRGWGETLRDPKILDLKRRQEAELRAYVDADPARKAKYGVVWDEIAAAQATYRNIATRHRYLEGEGRPDSKYFTFARQLVRGGAERAKPNNERLREYTDARLPAVTQRLFSTAPVYPEFEKVTLALSLEKLREWLGADDPYVRDVLDKESPRALAARLVDGTRLGDAEVRKTLWNDGAALAKSDDPFIALARRVDSPARAIRKRKEDEVDAVVDRNSELIAAARFEKYGTSVYPDCTFTLRLSFGEVKGWDEKGVAVAPFTEI
ncbi:MAG TPA: S46 family peptidase, partial [Caldimonas sp.]|nr:S46 family peptidase [Caldimonas sp.]